MLPGKSIFVVEDDLATREALTVLLEAQGYQVGTAPDGAEALARLRGGSRTDLILLDLTLPIMDGWDFREEQERDAALAGIPVVLVSAAGDIRETAEALAVAGYLAKPVNEDQLLAEVRRFTDPPRGEVLVVEDEPAVREMLRMALPHFGFSVRLAGGGEEAVEVYQRHRESIRLVLMDVQMPGLDGPHTLIALQKLDPAVRVAFMSGDTGDYSGEELLGLGAVHVFAKPFGSLGEFTQTLGRLTRTRGAS